ncbi:endoglucanase [Streptacidiphilus sp. MAP12-16]|uniref:glycoside hydrolase family 9 protein n=1 Tax=Streptacidiphilus sp. MAP12-16 TaxID=3156300 RepID=UPI003515A491
MGSSTRQLHRHRIRRPDRRVLTALAVGGGLVLAVVPFATAQAATTGRLRVDQVGYANGDTKVAYLMTSAAVSGATYQVVNSAGSTVASGSVAAASRGSWNSAYPDVYPIDFSGLTANGTYHIVTSGPVQATSDSFQIESAASLYGTLVTDGVNFYQNQRDGSDVIAGALKRKPAHLNDSAATVYKIPSFQSGGNGDVINGSSLTRIGGPVDVSGGWFDAGDYLKFTFTTANADNLLFASARALGTGAPASLTAEARYGSSWLNKMWNPSTKTLYLQVGIGSGNAAGTFYGDHDLWRLPEVDDSDTASADTYAAAHRPVFEAAAPGAKIDPDIVGRVAASFAFAAQADAAAGNSSQAATELANATSLYAMANTSPSSTLETAAPNAYYPESIWHDAMELGATEITLAQQALGQPSSVYQPYLTQAATWASDYIASDSGNDTFNLYDNSALAHADLITALGKAGNPSGLAVTPAALVANLKAQVASAAKVSAADIFREGGNYADFDVDAHTFGFITTEALYQKASGDTQYAAFAGAQRDWLLGGNAWGTSFMIGAGTTFPDCMGSQIPNIVGSTNGSSPIDTGAVVNGPNGTGNFSGGLGSLQSGMKKCENDSFTAFTGHGSEYVDDVRSWQTSEPALDMTGSAVLAGALQASLGGATPPSNDFSVSVSPSSGSVSVGGTVTATVATAVTAGSAETVALTASGAPAGVTVSLSPASVTSGGSSTLTVGTTASAAAGTYPITLTGSAASGSHTAAFNLTVTSGTGPSGGSFEAEAAANTRTGRAAVISCSACSGGARVGYIGKGATLTINGVTVTSAGSYLVTVAYTNGSTSARTAQISVNGGAAQSVAFAPTGAFTTPGTATVSLTLAAGTNTITFGNASASAPDLDRIDVPASPS